MKKCLIALLMVAPAVLSGPNPASAERDTLMQVATVGSLRDQGDLGIGTFSALDGEMVVLDRRVYRVGYDGLALEVSDGETTPFAVVTSFQTDRQVPLPPETDLESLTSLVNGSVSSSNLFYAFRLEGRFKAMRTRRVPRQEKPYRPLVEVVKDQTVFDLKDVERSVVGFYCPPFVSGINVPGYHLHFLTADRTAGGHVLGFTVDEATLKIDTLDRFVLHLPPTDAFAQTDLTRERRSELDRVER